MTGLEWIALAISSLATTPFIATSLYIGTYLAAYGALAFGASLLVPQPEVPTPEDGNYNLRQPVPSLPYVLGRVKKASDYVFLEQTGGDAYHILCWAGHRIEGYVSHYLHDELVTLDGADDVISPSHFVHDGNNYVNIKGRLGSAASTAYADVVAAFPTIWSNNHRGDGLATVRLYVRHTAVKYFQATYPHGMPQHSAVGDGMRLYDPRTGSTAFSTNIALMRFWHLSHPVGGKLNRDDLYLPEWQRAADVCDQNVLNRDGATEDRYHGGFWFRGENNPADVGRIMDQAAELVVYERPDGLVGVHAGEYVEPDITLTANDIVRVLHDVHQRLETSVLSVRGRWTNPQNKYATADAALWGDPYIGEDTERSKTIENQAVQSHNHMQRLQKLAFIRANAPRVTIIAHYQAAKNVPYRRFVRVKLAPRLNNVVIEITSSPKLSLRNLTVEFSGIVVPEDLYAFNAATEEGFPPPIVVALEDEEVPEPEGFGVSIESETVGGGATVAYARATWDEVNDEFTYELAWRATTGSDTAWRSVMSEAGDNEVRSNYLKDGFIYDFRLRTWAFGAPSDWTSIITKSVHADTIEPLSLRSFTMLSSAPHLGFVTFELKTKNDAHLRTIKLYRRPAGAAFDPDTHASFVELLVNPSATYNYTDGDDTRTNLISNGNFGSDTVWTKGSGWTIGSGVASKAAGAASSLKQGVSFTTGASYRYTIDVTRTAGSIVVRLEGGTNVPDVTITADGTYRGELVAVAGNADIAAFTTSAFVGTVDNFHLYRETADCAPAGEWDYYAVPFNPSGIDGPVSGPLTITIV